MLLLIIFIVELFFASLIYIYLYKIREIQLRNKRYNSYMDSMEAFYQLLTGQIMQMRRFRHDLQNHIRTMEYIQSQAKEEKASDRNNLEGYITDVKQIYEIVKPVTFCDNEIVNGVLVIKRKQCVEKKIRIDIKTDNIDVTGIQELDFAALLHNLLDNAIEANERIGEIAGRWISFDMKMEKESGNLVIVLENAVKRKEKILFKTEKENPDEHGFGRKIIGDIVGKYHGRSTMELDDENGVLKETILFPKILGL